MAVDCQYTTTPDSETSQNDALLQNRIGWFAVYREGLTHDFFEREPVTEWEAWVRLIARAAWSDTKHRIRGKMHPVKRGSFFCTLRELRDEFHWKSDKKVRGFLARLKQERMISLSTDAAKTQVTICNYGKYQDVGRSEDAARTQRGRTKEQDNNIPPKGGLPSEGVSNPAKIIFDSGVQILKSAGKSDTQARAILGGWRKANDDAQIIAALGACQREGAVDPVSFITAALKARRRVSAGAEIW